LDPRGEGGGPRGTVSVGKHQGERKAEHPIGSHVVAPDDIEAEVDFLDWLLGAEDALDARAEDHVGRLVEALEVSLCGLSW
jgi:hypothetical protein